MQPIDVEEVKGVWQYLLTIDWTDPWLSVLIAVHIFITVVTIWTRRHSTVQTFLFFALLLLVYFSENINEIAAENWRYFSREQYFDSKGMFISFVFSVPLLFNCLIMVVNWAYQSANLMISVKRKQLISQQRRASKQCEGDSGEKKKAE